MVVDIFDACGRQLRRVVIEAKYRSGKSQGAFEEEARNGEDSSEPVRTGDQLADLYLEAFRDHQEGRIPAEVPPALVYLTSHFQLPQRDLEETLERIRTRDSRSSPELFWLGWWRLDALLGESWDNRADRAIADDLRNLLKRRGLKLLHNAWCRKLNTLGSWRFNQEAAKAWWERTFDRSQGDSWCFLPTAPRWFHTRKPDRILRWRFT